MPVDNTSGIYIRYDPASANAKWYREQFASVEEWKTLPENQAPGKDVLEAFMAFEQEYVEKTQGEMVVPWHIANVNPQILTKMLRSTGTISAPTEVETVSYKPIGDNEEGRLGVLSCIFRLSVTYNNRGGNDRGSKDCGGGPLSIIYKACPLTPDFAMLRGLAGRGCRAWEIECKAYANFETPQNFFLGTTADTPKGYFYQYDEEALRYCILMEDLATRSTPAGPVIWGRELQLYYCNC